MARDTSVHTKAEKSLGLKGLEAQREAASRKRRSAFTPPSAQSKKNNNPIHRALKYHERKLLKRHDFLQYPEDNWHEPFCITKYHLEDREDYRRYLRLVGLIRQLMTHLRYLPQESRIRVQITQQLMDKLYNMGLIAEKLGLSEVDKIGVEGFCKRRLPNILVELKMAPNCKLASEMIHHGHIRAGTNTIRDPAFLVPRVLEDYVTWVGGSKIKSHVDTFNARRDDYAE